MQKLAAKAFIVLVVGGLAALAPGCVENNSSIFIHSIDFIDSGDTCSCNPDPSDDFISTGTLDISQRRAAYVGAVRIGNQMIRSADPDRLRVETSHVTIYEAEVEIFDANGASLSSFTQPISSFAFASSGSTAGYGCAFITLIDGNTIPNIPAPQTVVSRIKVRGETLGGNDVETGVFDFPIAVCDGCLGCVEPAAGDCDNDVQATACNVGQDVSPDCRCVSDGTGMSRSQNCPGAVVACH